MNQQELETLVQNYVDRWAAHWPGVTVRTEIPITGKTACAEVPTFKVSVPGVAELTFVPDNSEPDGLIWVVDGNVKGKTVGGSGLVAWGCSLQDYCEAILDEIPEYLKGEDE